MMPHLSSSTRARWLCAAGALAIIILLLVSKKPWDILAAIGIPDKPKHFAAIYGWWAGAMNAVLLAVFAVTAPWWLRPALAVRPWLPKVSAPRWFWPLVLAAMALTAAMGWQRISYSLWDDEENSLRRVIHGEFRKTADSRYQFKKAGWEQAFWNYSKPTNHILQTLLSKASLHLWQATTRAESSRFREWIVRFPGYIAGVLSIGALALLIKRLGLARAGVVAAFLLALHPWHIRYTTELRGYSLTLLLGPLMLYCLLEAISSGRWRWWLGFALSEFALLYAYPGCLYVLIAGNACGVLALWMRHDTARDRAIHLPRLLVASTLAVMIYLQFMLPCLPQLAEYLQSERALGALTTRWHYNMMAHFAAGIPWNNSDNASAGYPELLWMVRNQPWLKYALIIFPSLFFLAGSARLFLARPAGWIAAITMLLPALAVYVQAREGNQYLYEWYLIFALPGLAACTALGLDWSVQPLERWRCGGLAASLLLVLAVFFHALAGQPARHWFLTNPLQPARDSVLGVRPSLDPDDPRQAGIITVSQHAHLRSYDPSALSVASVADLREVARQADAEKKPLFVILGNEPAASFDSPELVRFLREEKNFDLITTWPALDLTLTLTVWRYKSGSIAPPATGP